MDGLNWAIFIMCFWEAMQATWHWPFFEGTVPCPTVKDPTKMTNDKKKAVEKWDHEDLAECYLLSQRLPDSIAVHLQVYTTVKTH